MFIVYLYCAATGEPSAATSQVHPGVLRIINARVNNGFPQFKLMPWSLCLLSVAPLFLFDTVRM